MIDDCKIEGQHPHEIGVDGRSDISVHIPKNEKGNFFGFTYDKYNKESLKARVCPNCGKVELYIDIKKQ